MKKLFAFIFVLFAVILSTTCVQANAFTDETDLILISSETTYESDGSYTVSNLYTSSIAPIGDVYNTYGKRDVTKYSTTNTVLWVYTLTGYFTVDTGVSCVCYDASYTYNISGSGWSFSNGSTTYYDNVANGKGTFKHKLLFVTTQTVNIDLYLACDEYGNLS